MHDRRPPSGTQEEVRRIRVEGSWKIRRRSQRRIHTSPPEVGTTGTAYDVVESNTGGILALVCESRIILYSAIYMQGFLLYYSVLRHTGLTYKNNLALRLTRSSGYTAR